MLENMKIFKKTSGVVVRKKFEKLKSKSPEAKVPTRVTMKTKLPIRILPYP